MSCAYDADVVFSHKNFIHHSNVSYLPRQNLSNTLSIISASAVWPMISPAAS
jgi:hypothetical protein